MPPARSQPQAQSAASIVLVVVIAAGIAASVFRMPGIAFIWVGIGVAAFFSVPSVLTGPKDSAGYPTAANPKEARSLAAGRKWGELKWKLFVPNADWLANEPRDIKAFLPSQNPDAVPTLLKPVVAKVQPLVYLFDIFGLVRWLVIPAQFTTYMGIGAALAAFTFPTDAIHLDLVWVNAAAAYISVTQTAATIRRHANQFDPSPGVRIRDLTGMFADGRGFGAATISVLFATAAGVGVFAGLVHFEYDWLVTPAALTGAGVAILLSGAMLHAAARNVALQPWRNTMAARAQWKPRWEGLKQDPYLISHERVGANEILVDTFEAPGTLGSAGAINLRGKLLPFMGSGVQFALLPVPDVDSQGQPVEGSKHATRFRVVTLRADMEFDVTSPDIDADELRVYLEVYTSLAMEQAQQWQPILTEVKAISDPAPDEEGNPATMAWASTWVLAEAPAAGALGAGAGYVGGLMETEAYADSPGGVATLYFGAVTADTTNLLDPSLIDRLEELEVEARWERRWYDLLKLGEKPPVLQYSYRQESALTEKATINSQPFVVKQGLDPTAFFSAHVKKGLSTTLAAAPFVTVTGYPANGLRPGDRHPQGFTVLWSASPIPTSPSEIPPSAAKQAAKWAIAGTVNDAFDAAKLNRPEVVSARALTHKDGFTHIWKITLRLYDGVTSEMVKKSAEKLRLSMGGCAWLRVTESVDGCEIYAGADPKAKTVKFAHPAKRNMEECIKLDWEQAFIDARMVSPADGSAPKLQRTDVLPTNEKVQVLEFTLPRGTHRGLVREAVTKLQGSTGNDFIQVMPGTTQESFILLVCPDNPMPYPAKFNWDAMAKSKYIPFATGVEGEPIVYDWSEDVHLLILGGSGSGKSATIQVLLTGALMKGAEVYLADPSKLAADFRFAAPWMKAVVTTELEASAMMNALYDEVKRRRALNGQHAVASYKDLPDDVRPPHVFVFLDEFTSLMMADALPKPTGNETEEELKERAENEELIAAKRNIGSKAGRIAREARSAGMTLVLATQALKADTLKSIPGAGDLKANLSSIILGKTSFGQLQSALKEPTDAPDLGESIPRGRGLFESSAFRAKAIQSWFDSDDPQSRPTEHVDSMVAHLTEALPHLTPEQKLNLDAYRKTTPSGPVFGEIIGGPAGEAVEDDTVIDLGEVGMDLDIDFDALPGTDAPPLEVQGEQDQVRASEDVDECPTVAAGQVVLLGVGRVLSPIEDTSSWDDFTYTAGGPGGEYLRSHAMLGQVAETLERSDTTALWLTDWGRDAVRAFGDQLVADVIPRGLDGLGWWKLDAFQQLLTSSPGISRVVWVDDQLNAEDDIGVPYSAIAADIADRRGVDLVTIVPADGLTAGHVAQIADALVRADQEPTPVATPAPTTAHQDTGLFDTPAVAIPAQPNLFD